MTTEPQIYPVRWHMPNSPGLQYAIRCTLYATLYTQYAIRFTKLPSTSVENPLQISYFLCKTNPILSAVGGLQTQYIQRIMKINGSGESGKTNPIQTQSNPI